MDSSAHHVRLPELLTALKTQPSGLSVVEAERRLLRVGPNTIRRTNEFSILGRLFAQLTDLMIVILLVAATIAFVFRETQDGIVLIGIVFINVLIGFSQEYKADQSVKKLEALVPRRAYVLRGGKLLQIHRDLLVPGDIVRLNAGDFVPADGRLMMANDLQIDEAAMTGESIPAPKFAEMGDVAKGTTTHLVSMGTVVKSGTGEFVITTTGDETRLGSLATSVATVQKDASPVTQDLQHLARRIALFATILLVLVIIYGIVTGRDLYDHFFFALALAVSVVPEGLAATVSVAMSVAATRLAKQQALVKRLNAIETLGAVTVICTDKTGTLTENTLRVQEVWTAPGKTEKTLRHIAALAGNAHIDTDPKNDLGDPLEVALARWATGSGENHTKKLGSVRRVRELPFHEAHRMMSVLVQEKHALKILTKGAPEYVLNACSVSQKTREAVETELARLTGEGHRVLALAERIVPKAEIQTKNRTKLESKLTFVGLVALADPPRHDAAKAVASARGAGIRVLMLTGDDPRTAASIARRIGILRNRESLVVSGMELETMTDDELITAVQKPAVFARITPEQKLRIVNILKESGDVVAVTGDGVNDGPALKRADIGIAMGRTGSDVARETADLILLDDSFASIIRAIEQGRILYANLKKTIWFMLAADVGELFTILIGTIFQLPLLPLQAIQILAINIGADILPAFALATSPSIHNVLADKPRPTDTPLVTQQTFKHLLSVGSIIGLGAVASFLQVIYRSTDIHQTALLYSSATMAAFAAIVLCQIVNSFEAQSPMHSAFSVTTQKNPLLIWASIMTFLLLLAAIYLEPLQTILRGGPLILTDWIVPVLTALVLLVFEEIRKAHHQARND